jgi:hypothetical protein
MRTLLIVNKNEPLLGENPLPMHQHLHPIIYEWEDLEEINEVR